MFCQELAFLVKERFISVTYRATYDGALAIRIYIIPHDLSNGQGALRIRKESVLNPAKRYMRSLLPRISQNVEKWNGLEKTLEDYLLLPDINVCIAAIFLISVIFIISSIGQSHFGRYL